MDNLAFAYSALGKHAEALAMKEKALEFNSRALPENDPDIGEHHVCSDTLHVHWRKHI
jgi:hypothetical protein